MGFSSIGTPGFKVGITSAGDRTLDPDILYSFLKGTPPKGQSESLMHPHKVWFAVFPYVPSSYRSEWDP